MVAKDSYNSLNGHAMTGGNGLQSYTKNSSYQRSVIDAAKLHIHSATAEKLQPENFTALETFCVADLGCSVGPNTFFAVQNILDAVKLKYKTYAHKIPEFQVFFNDHSMNDFNTLFKCLPPNREYYASGVPGSFYSRLFLRASVHLVHSSYSLHWLSQVPKEVTNRKSLAWNKGRIYHLHAREEVTKAYSMQHAMDMTNFLFARAEEVVPSGLVAIIVPARPNGTPHDQVIFNMMFDNLGSCLMELSKKGLIDKEKVDSFNIPAYCTCPQELEAVIEKNGCFSIESMESLATVMVPDTRHRPQDVSLSIRAITEELIREHFGAEILDELFNLFTNKVAEAHNEIASGTALNLFLLLKRKTYIN